MVLPKPSAHRDIWDQLVKYNLDIVKIVYDIPLKYKRICLLSQSPWVKWNSMLIKECRMISTANPRDGVCLSWLKNTNTHTKGKE